MTAEQSPEPEIHREVVSIGIDFRPVPIDMGDGVIWNFDPDPSPDKWETLTRALTAFGGIEDLDEQKPDPKALNSATSRLMPLTAGLTDAIAGILVEPVQRKKFVTRAYSMFSLQRLANTLMEVLSGFPTK